MDDTSASYALIWRSISFRNH